MIVWSYIRSLIDKIGADASSYNDVMNKIKENTPGGGTIGENSVINVINYFLYVGGIVAVVMAIVAGVQMTTSAGDPGAVKKAKTTLTWAIAGLVVMILAYAIVNFVIAQLGNE